MKKRFAGKTALVTGATNGIGQATAVRLAAEGALVGVNQRPTGDPRETLRRIKEAGGEGFPVVAHMRDPEQVIKMVQEVARRGGRLDYLVSNAAINPLIEWDKITLEDFNRLSETNFRGKREKRKAVNPYIPSFSIRIPAELWLEPAIPSFRGTSEFALKCPPEPTQKRTNIWVDPVDDPVDFHCSRCWSIFLMPSRASLLRGSISSARFSARYALTHLFRL